MRGSAAADSQGLTLDELLERARNTSGLVRLDWRDPIAAHGVAAIEAIKSWLADPGSGFFATIVIRRIGQSGHTEPALNALRDGIVAAPHHVREHIRTAIEQLGGTLPPPSHSAPGGSLIGWYMIPAGSMARDRRPDGS